MICIYAKDATDFGGIGLSLLTPVEASVSWRIGGMYEAEVIQPIDDTNRWALMQVGNIVKIDVPVRESPIYEYTENPQPTESKTVEIYVVKDAALNLRDGASISAKKLGTYRIGTEVTKVSVSGSWMQVVIREGGATGWMNTRYLRYDRTETETISGGRPEGQRVITLKQSRSQLFRIYEIEQNTEEGTVTARARHVFYDLAGNLYDGEYDAKDATGAEVIAEITAHLSNEHPFRFHTEALTGGSITNKYSYINPVEAFLDPDTGVVSQCKCQIIRDGFDVHFIDDAPNDMGVTVRRGKNLIGVTANTDNSDVVTRIKPCGKDVEGDPLWLTDDASADFVDSPHIAEVPFARTVKKDYDVKLVKKDEDNVTTFRNNAAGKAAARAKLRELAEKDFEDGADQPYYTMNVNFVLLQDTDADPGYAALQSVHPYDTVTVIDSMIGLSAKVRVTAYEWDALAKQYTDVTLGDLVDVQTTTYSYNLPNGGISGTKIMGGTLDGGALRTLSVPYAKFDVAAVDQLSADALTAHAAYISELTAQSIDADTVSAAYAHLFEVVAEQIRTGSITTGTLAAAMATVNNASIGTAQIGYAQIMDATIAQLITHDAIADKFFIEKLMVRNLQVVEQTVGSLIVKSSDGNYYRLDIDTAAGTVVPTIVTVTEGEIAAGVTSDERRSIIETDLTVADLSASSVKAINALIDKITASRIEVDTLVAREAFIQALRTAKIVGNQTIQMYVDASTSKIFRQNTQPQNGFKDGDMWVRPETGETFQAVHAEGFEAFYYDPDTGVLSYSDSDALTLTLGSDGTIQGVSVAEDGTLIDVVTWERVRESEVDAMLASVSQYRDVMQVEADGVHVRAGVLDESGNVRIDSNAPNVHIRSDGFGIVVPTYQGAGGDDKYRWIASANAGAFQDLKVYTAAGCVNLKARAPGEIFFERR